MRATSLGVKKQVGKPPGYVNTLKKLELQRERLLHEADACTQLSALTLQREQVLLDLLAVQEALMQHIQASSCSGESDEPATQGFGRADSSSAQVQQQQAQQQQALQPQLAHMTQQQQQQHMWQQVQERQQGRQAQHAQQQQQQQQQQERSYMARLLASVTPEQLQRVMTMTTNDWSAFFADSFTQLVVLLELCQREEPPPAQQHLLLHPQQQTAAATAAQPAAPPAASEAQQAASGVCFSGTLSRLHALVDEWVVLSAIALIHNPVPLYLATTLNHATRAPASPPPGARYWTRLVQRLGLTRQQALHFAVAMGEIGRLDKATLQHGDALARTAACPSLLVAASSAAAADLAGAAAAADGSGGDAAQQQQQQQAARGRGRAAPSAARSARNSVASTQQSGAGSVGSAAAAAAAAASNDDGSGSGDGSDGDGGGSSAPVTAEVLLQRKVQRLPLQGVLLLSFNCNTLSRLQVAKVIVYSWPFLPMTMAIGAAAAKLFEVSMLGCDERGLLLGAALPSQEQRLLHVEQEQLWQRCCLLQRQQHSWWREHAGAWA